MAYAAVLSLMQLVDEYLISFPRKLLEIENFWGRRFVSSAELFLGPFENLYCFPNPNQAKLKEQFEALLLKIDKEFEKAARQVPLPSSLDRLVKIETRKLPEFHATLYKNSGVNSSLQAIADLPLSATLSEKRFRDFVNVLLVAYKKIERVITLFNSVAKEASSLHDRVGTLLQKLKESNHDQVVNCIKFAADKASDSIEDFLTGHPFVLEKEDLLELPAMEIHPQKGVKNIFDLLKDIDLLLSHTLEVVSSISRENENHKAFSALQLDDYTQPESSRRKSQLAGKWRDKPESSRRRSQLASPRNKPESSLLTSQFLSTSEMDSWWVDDDIREINDDVIRETTSEVDSQICELVEIIYKKQEDIVVGHDDDMSKIIDELIRPPSELTIVGIAGMGGIGKTTLAKQVFHHAQIVHHFHCRAWVNIVPNIRYLLSHLLDSITPSRDKIPGQTNEDMGEILRKSLKGRKYLIVMDDLWEGKALDAIRIYFPDDRVGSRILITSRLKEFSTSTSMIPKNPPHCMRLLNQDQSWELLEKLVFGKESCPLELVDVGKGIAENCGGLPLAIVVIAGTLFRIPKSDDSWLRIRDSIISVVSANPNGCLDILALSYTYLPHHLKACFLFMGAFPAHFEIEVEKLISLWIAEGFLEPTSSNPPEIVAERYLEDLINRNLVSVGRRSFDGKIKTCLIHDVLRQLCLREAQKENFMHFSEAQKENFMNFSEAEANPKQLEKQRHLIFYLDSCDDFKSLPSLPHLRSFVLLNRGHDFTPGMVVLQMSIFTWLRVLDLYFLPLDAFPEQLLNLINLRYLALNVTFVPHESISRFWKLQTLIINGPWISWDGVRGNPILLLEWWKMPWLRHLNFRVPSCLSFPQQKHSSSNIQILSTITFSSLTVRNLDDFMPQLKKLGVSETKEDYENGTSNEGFNSLFFLRGLEILKCFFDIGYGHARRLNLGKLPHSLKMLTLSGSGLLWNEMKLLARLPNLEMLKLKNHAFLGPKWVVQTEEVFRRLKRLMIDDRDLVNWETESTIHFPCLERLVLRSCKSLEKIPCGVGELSDLEVIELHNCSKSAENSAREYEEQYGSPKVVIRSDKVEDE